MEVVSAARTARESLARGLGALQGPGLPPQLLVVAEPVAHAMGALHRIESSGGAALVEAAPSALGWVRQALALLQAQQVVHPAVDQAMEAIASSLGLVHQLAQLQPAAPQAPTGVSGYAGTLMAPAPTGGFAPSQTAAMPPSQQHYAQPQAALPAQPAPGNPSPAAQQPRAPQHGAPAYPHGAASPAGHAPQAAPAPPAAYAPPPAPPHQPPAYAPQAHAPHAHAPQAHAPQAHAPAGYAPEAAPAPQSPPAYVPPQAQRAATAPAAAVGERARVQQPTAAAAMAHADGSGPMRVEAALGAHSATNFYKGLSGNDVIESGGIFVGTYQIPSIGSNVVIKVSLPGGYEFEALGVVRWTREASESGADDVSPGFGAQFTQISPEGRQLVYRYVRNREPLFHDEF